MITFLGIRWQDAGLAGVRGWREVVRWSIGQIRTHCSRAADTVELMQRDVRIRRETISLAQLLKLEGLIGSGAESKTFLSAVLVSVNGASAVRRGRKLRLDDVVRVGALDLRVTSADLDIRYPERRGVHRPADGGTPA